MSTIPEGSIVLVTGVSGFIGAHVADQLLQKGFRVRGAVRSLEKANWLAKHFDATYGKGKYEAVHVPDMTTATAYDEALKGVSGIVHLASVVTFSNVPDEVIPIAIQGATNIVAAAKKEPGIKSIVLTSSVAALPKQAGSEYTVVTEQSWNSAVVKAAKGPSPNGWEVYGASKTEAERAFWDAVQFSHFQAAAVLPSAVFGRFLGPATSVTDAWIPQLYEGSADGILPHSWFNDVGDAARLHVAALIDPSANGRRIFGTATPYNVNDLLTVLRRQYPNRKFIEDVSGPGSDTEKVIPAQRGFAQELLKTHFGKDFTSLDESVKNNVERYLEIKA